VRLGRPRLHTGLRVAATTAAFALLVEPAAGASGYKRDTTPLPSSLTKGSSTHTHSSDGASFMRLGLGLVLVIGLIFGIRWIVKRSNGGPRTRSAGAIRVVDTAQLAPNRAVHLVRVGEELVLVGSGENGVAPIRVYSAEEARTMADSLEREETLKRGGPTRPAPAATNVSLLASLRRRTAR
jgi:flagellar biosynthetic protein FliO